MAYSKYAYRSRFRRRPRTYRRKLNYGRRATGVKRYRRYPRRYRRRPLRSRAVRNIASAKKYDTMLGSTGESEPPLPDSFPIYAGSNYMLWCPTYRPHDEESGPHHRNAWRVFWRGVRERILLSVSFEVIHRRVCFWSYRRHDEGAPILNPETSSWRRPLRRISPIDDPEIFEQLWKGTLDEDYSENNRWNAPLDNRRYTIVYDKSYTINPNYDVGENSAFGKSRSRKMWHPLNCTLMYDQDEAGIGDLDSAWAALAPATGANFYILDIFSTGQDLGDDTSQRVGTFTTTANVYWHEQN